VQAADHCTKKAGLAKNRLRLRFPSNGHDASAYPLRLDFTPSNLILIQLAFREVFRSSTAVIEIDDDDVHIAIVTKSPKAQPRLQWAAATPARFFDNSSNTPCPRFRKTARGVLFGYCGSFFSIFGRHDRRHEQVG